MAVVAPPSRATRPELVINQTHADVTRDVVATLEPASRGYLLLLGLAVAMFLGGLTTFLILVKDGLGHRYFGASTSRRSCSGSASGTQAR